MNNLTVALLQMTSNGPDEDANLAKGDRYCRMAAKERADLALFPEMWNIGYTFYESDSTDAIEDWKSKAISRQSRFIEHFQGLSKELRMAIGITYLEKTERDPMNSVSLIDRTGRIVLTYSKVHTCAFLAERAVAPGRSFPVCELETAGGTVRLGFMICYDREFPEAARILMLNGAELILVPNACDIDQNRLDQLKTRAFENATAVAMANYGHPQNNGRSVVFDGMAERDGNAPPSDMTVVQAEESEGIYLARLDLAKLRAYRTQTVWGDAYRRPVAYDRLVESAVRSPFCRPDAT